MSSQDLTVLLTEGSLQRSLSFSHLQRRMGSARRTEKSKAELRLGASAARVITCFRFTYTARDVSSRYLSYHTCKRLSGGLDEIVPANHLARETLNKHQPSSRREFRGSVLEIGKLHVQCKKRLRAVMAAALRRSFSLTGVLPTLEENGDFILGIYGRYCLTVVSPEISG